MMEWKRTLMGGVAAIATMGMVAGGASAAGMSGGDVGATGDTRTQTSAGQQGHMEASENPDTGDSDTLRPSKGPDADIDHQAAAAVDGSPAAPAENPAATGPDRRGSYMGPL